MLIFATEGNKDGQSYGGKSIITETRQSQDGDAEDKVSRWYKEILWCPLCKEIS